MVLVTLRLRGRGLTLASLAHVLAAIHPAVSVAIGATGAAFAMPLTVGRALLMALVLALLMLGMIGRLGGRSGLRKGRRCDRKRERGNGDLHDAISEKSSNGFDRNLRRSAEGAGQTLDEGPDATLVARQ